MITARVFPLLFFFVGAFGIQNHLSVLKVAGLLTAYRCLVTGGGRRPQYSLSSPTSTQLLSRQLRCF
jgi:hypothetical protein